MHIIAWIEDIKVKRFQRLIIGTNFAFKYFEQNLGRVEILHEVSRTSN